MSVQNVKYAFEYAYPSVLLRNILGIDDCVGYLQLSGPLPRFVRPKYLKLLKAIRKALNIIYLFLTNNKNVYVYRLETFFVSKYRIAVEARKHKKDDDDDLWLVIGD